MNKTYITADLHLGESRFQLMGRPFTSTEEHNGTILERHNALVRPDDTLIIVGDVVYEKTPEYLPLIATFNGRKILIRGNHDRVFTDADLAPYFEQIIPEGDGLDIKAGNLECWITHYPTQGQMGKFNLVGHIHAAFKYQLNMLNIGVDVHHFYPVDLESIPFHFTAVKDFYDDDVWVAYSAINHKYFRNGRGKIGTYFNKNGK
jgi:calcineurin-like phosphoesterase family protein